SAPPRASSPPRAAPPPRPPSLPPRLTPPPLPAARTGSIPPAALPRPSDPPRADAGAAQRQQLAQLITQLEAARAAATRQQAELDSLRARVDERGAQLTAPR